MTLRKIASLGHPVLRRVSEPVALDALQDTSTQTLIDDLVQTMRDANGAGLAAPQVYAPTRICVIEVSDNPRYPYKPNIPLTILVNPVITPVVGETFENFEGCLSVPNLRGRVRRYAHIRVQAIDRHGAPLDFEARGITAGTFQHEVDHLDGKLFLDHVFDTRSLCTWEHFERYEKDRFAAEAASIADKWGS